MRILLYLVIFIILFLNLFYPLYTWAHAEGNVYTAGIPPIAGILDYLILPQEKVEIVCASNVNPHTFDISPSQLQKLTKASIFFHTRFPYELKIVNALVHTKSGVQCVDVTQGIVWREGHIHADEEHPHKHEEEDRDLHCWLSPVNLKIISSNIYTALISRNPEKKEDYHYRYEKWIGSLEEMDVKIKSILSPHQGKSIFVYHPAFGYFVESYGLREYCIEMEGKSPSPKQMQFLLEKMKKEKTKVIFVQPQFDPRPAEVIAKAVGGRIEVVNDFERDVLKQLLFIAEKISESYN